MGYVDADAHVIETEETWAYLAEADKAHTPLVVTQSWGHEVIDVGRLTTEYWLMDNRIHAKDRNVGADFPAESREMRDVGARLAHILEGMYPGPDLDPRLVRRQGKDLATGPRRVASGPGIGRKRQRRPSHTGRLSCRSRRP